jgi:hypothetical protein
MSCHVLPQPQSQPKSQSQALCIDAAVLQRDYCAVPCCAVL